MNAVILAGGKQYRVHEGQTLKIELLEAAHGDSISFDKVLMIVDGDNVNVGMPYVSGGSVTADIIRHGRAKKIKVIKFKRRKHHMKQMGHRQWFTEVKITGINAA